jgi:hypothetical protein
MATQVQELSRHDLEAKIVKRCWEDELFCKEFMADPAGAFEKHLKIQPASLPKIVVHQEEANTWHIVLPPKPVESAELSEQDLETVAGGMTTLVCAVGTIAASLASAGTIATTVVATVGW